MATAFFSYSRNDSEFALRLAEDLKAAGQNVWLDQLDIVPGQQWDRAIEEELTRSPRILVILSPSSVESPNVMDEVSFALEEGKTVVPIIYKNCKIPFRLRRLQHVDFTQDYARGLKNLLKALVTRPNAEERAPMVSEPQGQVQAEIRDVTEAQTEAEQARPSDAPSDRVSLEEEQQAEAEDSRHRTEAPQRVDAKRKRPEAGEPLVHSPDQREADVASLPLVPNGAFLAQKTERARKETEELEREAVEATRPAVESSAATVLAAPPLAPPEIVTPSDEAATGAAPPATHLEEPAVLTLPSSRPRLEAPARSRGIWSLVTLVGIAVALLSGGSWWYAAHRPQAKAIGQLNQGIEFYRHSQFSAATNSFQTAVHDDAKLVRGWLYLGASYAQQCYKEPDDPQVSYRESRWKARLSQVSNRQMCTRAKEAFEEASRIDPNNKLALAAIGSMDAAMNDFEKAGKQFRQLVEVDPSNPASYTWIGAADWAICFDRTEELRLKLGIIDNPFRGMYPEKARAELENQNGPLVEEGLKALSKALEIKPNDDTTLVYLNLLYRQKAWLERNREARAAYVKTADDLLTKALKAREARAVTTTDAVYKDFEFALPAPPPPPPPPPAAP
jgi:Tfp pilus assembly protein PilF